MIYSNPAYPGTQIGFSPKTVNRLKCLDKSFLHKVFSPMRIADYSQTGSIYPSVIFIVHFGLYPSVVL